MVPVGTIFVEAARSDDDPSACPDEVIVATGGAPPVLTWPLVVRCPHSDDAGALRVATADAFLVRRFDPPGAPRDALRYTWQGGYVAHAHLPPACRTVPQRLRHTTCCHPDAGGPTETDAVAPSAWTW